MPRLDAVQKRDDVATLKVKITAPGGSRFATYTVEFYPNRVRAQRAQAPTPAPQGDGPSEESMADALMDGARKIDDEAVAMWLSGLKSWDAEGPLEDFNGTVIVPEGEVIPLEVEYVRFVEPWFRVRITEAINDMLFPSLRRLTSMPKLS